MFKAKSINMNCGTMNIGAGSVYEATESMNLMTDLGMNIDAGAVFKFHGHTMTISAPCTAKSIISIDDHTLQVTELSGATHNYDMNHDVSYPQ